MSRPPPAEIRRIIYLGTPALAVSPLRALLAAGYDISLVVSGPDARQGRGQKKRPAPVKAVAEELGLATTDDLLDLASVPADLAVVVAFGQLIPAPMLDALSFVNLHFSLLPRWRGAAPVERAILAGDRETGVCLMDVAEDLDTGDVYSRGAIPIGDDETLADLRGRLVEMGTVQLLVALAEGFPTPSPQYGDPSYAAKITATEREINWSQSALEVHRRVRVEGAFTIARGKRLKVLRSRVVSSAADAVGVVVPSGSGYLELLEVQPEGKLPMDARAWSNGARWTANDRLGE